MKEENSETVDVPKLVRLPPTHGHWYLARIDAEYVEFANPVEPELKVRRHMRHFKPADFREYPTDLCDTNCAYFSSTGPLHAGDTVLARIRPAFGSEHRGTDYGYEMGQILYLGTDYALVGFHYGISEAARYGDICRMYLGGPTRLDYLARGIYAKRRRESRDLRQIGLSIAPSVEVMCSRPINLALPPDNMAGGATLVNQAVPSNNLHGMQSITATTKPLRFGSFLPLTVCGGLDHPESHGGIHGILAAVRGHLADLNYIRRPPRERKDKILEYSDRFEELADNVKFSEDGETFKAIWVLLVKRYHHNLPQPTKQRISLDLNPDWYKISCI